METTKSSLNHTHYANLLLYYFSGTGNARSAAEWIEHSASEIGITTHLINIDRFEKIHLPSLKDGRTLVGFCFPTHGFGPAPLMLKFISLFPSIENSDAFILNTRAGLKLSKLFVPGLSGLAQIVPAAILKSKGYKIVGMQPLDLPSNWISLHPGVKEKVKYSIFNRCKKIIDRFSGKVLSGKRVYKALISLPIDLLIAPISLGYYFFGRYAIAKTFIATDSCNNCGLCIEQCPVNSIKMVNNKPFWTYRCESCMRCMNNCPKRSIETAHIYTALVWYIGSSLLVPYLLYQSFAKNFMGIDNDSILNYVILNILELVFLFIIIIVGYRIMHKLLNIKFFNKLIKYSSFTTYKFWRRYKAPRNF